MLPDRRRFLPSLCAALALVAVGCTPPPPSRPNIVLILVDTLRADHVGCYGYSRPTTPWIDRLASRGERFAEALAQAPYTKASVASLFTGLFPCVHGALGPSDPIAEGAQSLAAALRGAGYVTRGYYLNSNVHALFGFDRGFDSYVHPGDEYLRSHGMDPSDPSRIPVSALDDRAIADELERLLATPPRSPFFLYLHFVGPHDPYAPPRDAPRSFVQESLTPGAARFFEDKLSSNEASGNTLSAMQYGLVDVDAATLRQMVELYDTEIAFTDAQIGRVLAAFDRARLTEHTLFIVTADHGEEFRDHGGLGHGRTQYRELLHVPLVMAGPGVASGVVEEPVRLIDVMPTLLELAGTEPANVLDGESFAASLAQPSTSLVPRVLYAEGMMPGVETPDPFLLRSLQSGSEKVILDLHRREKLMFDLSSDPHEQRNILSRNGEDGRALLERLVAQHEANRRRALATVPIKVHPGIAQQMLALGYVGGNLSAVELARRELRVFDALPNGLLGDEREVSSYRAQLSFADERFSPEQLLYGWWQREQDARWMARRAGARVKLEPGAREWFVTGYIDLKLHGRPSITITVRLDDSEPIVRTITASGLFELHGPLPPALGSLVRVAIESDHVFIPAHSGGADLRDLSILVKSLGLR